MERDRELDPRGQVPQRFAYFGFSRRLNGAFELCWRPRRKLTARLGMVSGRATSGGLTWLTADVVPQLFWEEEFERRIAGLLPGFLPRYAHRVCSVWLVKTADGCTGEDAAAALAIPTKSGRALANKAVSLLNAHGSAERFDATLREIVHGLAVRGTLCDYGSRRRALSGFTVIEGNEWRAMCRTAGVHPGKRGGRSRHAASWLWAHLTCGDHLLSPGFSERGSESDRDAYRRFVKESLPALEGDLKRYGRAPLGSSVGRAHGARQYPNRGDRPPDRSPA